MTAGTFWTAPGSGVRLSELVARLDSFIAESAVALAAAQAARYELTSLGWTGHEKTNLALYSEEDGVGRAFSGVDLDRLARVNVSGREQ